MSLFTVLGSSGFIGSKLVEILHSLGHEYDCPGKHDDLSNRDLGTVVYCIGLTADFRSRPFETIEAHVCKLSGILEHAQFDSLTYLSSARMYLGAREPACEEDDLTINPAIPDHLYNLSKLMGESLCLNSRKSTRIVRLSNVYGPDFRSSNFLATIVKDSLVRRRISLQTSLDSEKDYISIKDVIDLTIKIALGGRHKIYNLVSGCNLSNRAIIEEIVRQTGCSVEVAQDARMVAYPRICNRRIVDEFDYIPRDLRTDIAELIESFKERLKHAGTHSERASP